MKLELNNQQSYRSIMTIDAHTEGEPLRIIKSGYPPILGKTILEKRRYLLSHLDEYRQILMFEPRGHADMYGAIITEPENHDSDFGILFMHNEGYSSMCGHGILATVTVLMECGDIKVGTQEKRSIKIDSPAGLITAYGEWINNKPHVSFDCVPSFVDCVDQQIEVPDLGTVTYDILFGGAYYAYVDADALNIDCNSENSQTLILAGKAIKKAIAENYSIKHPEQEDLGFLYGVIFTSSKTTYSESHSRHVCVFADGEVDRSPTGTGVSGRAAQLVVKQGLPLNQAVRIESIISSHMTVEAIKSIEYYGKHAVIPRVTGRAFITGIHTFLIDEEDPFKQGFFIR
ncbi:proline racemase family protein [Temperatibacter marinus]|uniref:Proline racemase family protein n=1 Tax=Temperatibacter marinus TaxID=1456591 RepID=A0AA52H8F7_9PROT|nr:proline racemase family protein [Temperatibacter marinus]WND01794.1 proline racemase family protein [Temperatibacter marinus]